MRDYRISDDGDAIQLALWQDEQQVGGALFPDDGSGAAFGLALEVGEMWKGVNSGS